MKKIIICLLACLFCACARAPLAPPPDSGEVLWQKMLAANTQAQPYRIQFSLRFGEEGNTRRVTGILWGNDDKVMRMDIMAGVGATVARMLDEPGQFLVYATRENKLYYHNGPQKPVLRVGVPLPFDLSQLAALLNGHYGDIFGSGFAAFENEGGVPVFSLDNPPGGRLILDAEGRPESWKQNGNGWQLAVSYDESILPEQLKLEGPDGKRAIITVKERAKPAAPFDEEQMRLTVPENTPRLPLAQYKAS